MYGPDAEMGSPYFADPVTGHVGGKDHARLGVVQSPFRADEGKGRDVARGGQQDELDENNGLNQGGFMRTTQTSGFESMGLWSDIVVPAFQPRFVFLQSGY